VNALAMLESWSLVVISNKCNMHVCKLETFYISVERLLSCFQVELPPFRFFDMFVNLQPAPENEMPMLVNTEMKQKDIHAKVLNTNNDGGNQEPSISKVYRF
jgi:hypothetical protein